jgi:hypothetical protein
MGPLKRRVALSVIAAAALALGVPAAHGGRPDPVARIACDENATGPCSESGSIALPPGSYGSQSTDTVPNGSTQAVATVGSTNTDVEDLNAFDDTWESVTDAFPKLSVIKSKLVRRVITCAVLARGAAQLHYSSNFNASEEVNGTADAYYQAVLGVCIQIAVAGQRDLRGAPRAASASTRCSTVLVAVPVELQRTATGYRAVARHVRTRRGSSRGPLSVSCSSSPTGMAITLKPRSATAKLRQVIGPRLNVGFSNASKRSLTLHTTFAFS